MNLPKFMQRKTKCELIVDESVREFCGMTEEEIRREERRRLTAMTKGMATYELEIVLESIPVDLILAQLKKEIEKGKQFEANVSGAIGNLHDEGEN